MRSLRLLLRAPAQAARDDACTRNRRSRSGRANAGSSRTDTARASRDNSCTVPKGPAKARSSVLARYRLRETTPAPLTAVPQATGRTRHRDVFRNPTRRGHRETAAAPSQRGPANARSSVLARHRLGETTHAPAVPNRPDKRDIARPSRTDPARASRDNACPVTAVLERAGKRDVARLRPVAHTPQGDSEVPTPAALNRPRATRRRRAWCIRWSANASRASGVVRCPRKPASGDDARKRGPRGSRLRGGWRSSSPPRYPSRRTR